MRDNRSLSGGGCRISGYASSYCKHATNLSQGQVSDNAYHITLVPVRQFHSSRHLLLHQNVWVLVTRRFLPPHPSSTCAALLLLHRNVWVLVTRRFLPPHIPQALVQPFFCSIRMPARLLRKLDVWRSAHPLTLPKPLWVSLPHLFLLHKNARQVVERVGRGRVLIPEQLLPNL